MRGIACFIFIIINIIIIIPIQFDEFFNKICIQFLELFFYFFFFNNQLMLSLMKLI